MRLRYQFLALVLIALGVGSALWIPGLQAASKPPASHQLVGSWQLNMASEATVRRPALAVFTSDGTVLFFDPMGPVTVGSWSDLSERAGQLTSYAYAAPTDTECTGGRILGGAAEAGDAGDQITMIYTVQCFDVNGRKVSEQGPITATGALITVEAIPQPVATVLTP